MTNDDLVDAFFSEKSALHGSLEGVQKVAIVVADKLQTDEIVNIRENEDNSFLQGAVEQAASSFVAPHSARDSGIIQKFEEKQVASFKDEDVQSAVATADKSLVLTTSKAGAELDAFLKNLSEQLKEKTNGHFAIALTGAEANGRVDAETTALQRRLEESPALVCEPGYILSTANPEKPFCFSHFVLMTPEIFVCILFGFFFLAATCVGLSALDSIQTPTKFAAVPPPHGKEY